MDVMETIKKRYSVRSYQQRDVPDEIIRKIVEAARLAPSAKNRQEWKFVMIKDVAKRERLCEAAKGQTFVRQSPVVIAGVSTETDYVMTCGVPARYVDIAIAMEHIALTAVEYGLGTCWVGAFYQDKAKEVLNVPPDCQVVALMTLGYPEEGLEPAEKRRKSLEDIMCYEEFKR
ncbi:MAG: nitroreductase family protein [Candidatus Thermoplasmatota archaeon]|nr:nitroreductase family protein [Candidatus Thermoplasmatota archaeon]